MDDWKVGDLALCIYNGEITSNRGTKSKAPDLVVGRVYTVSEVLPDGLVVAELPRRWVHPVSRLPWGGFATYRFRKVTPPEADEFDREVIDLMTKQPAEVR